MVNAFTRLLIDSSEFSPKGIIMRAINPIRHYNRYRDEKSAPLLTPNLIVES